MGKAFEPIGDWCTVTLTEYDDDNLLGVQTDAQGLTPRARDGEYHHPYGFMGRPRDPEESGLGCTAWKWQAGGDTHTLVLDDPRVSTQLPQLDKGGSVFYGGSSLLSWQLIEDDGSVELYVPYSPNPAGVAQKCFALRFDTSTESITLQHSEGQTICLTKEKEIVLAISDTTHFTLSEGKAVLQVNEFICPANMVIGEIAAAVPLTQYSASTRLRVAPG